jgi:hypothetical protein
MSKTESTGRGRMREIRFSDTDAGSMLPVVKDPGEVKAPESADEKKTLVEWAKLAGHIAPAIPKGGYAHRGDRFRGIGRAGGFDVRILLVHMKAHATKERPFYENALYTRAQYDALVNEARNVACGSASPMRERVEAVVAHKGGFISKEEHARLTAGAQES